MSPKIRQTAYGVGSIATTIVTILALWHGIDGGTATALSNAITGLLGLLGVGATATATAVVGKQIKNGTLDQLSPVDQAITGIQATVAQAQTAVADVDRIKQAASDVLGQLPVLGPLAKSLIDSVKIP